MKEIKRSNLIRGFKFSLAISILVSVALLVKTVNFQELRQMSAIRPTYLLFAICIVFLMWFCQGISMQILATALGERLSLKHAVLNYLAGSFVSNVTPSSSGGGPLQIFLLHKEGMSVGKASSIITVQWALRQIFFGVLGPIFFFFYRDYINTGELPENIFNIAVLSGIFITFFLLFFIWKPRLIPLFTNWFVRLPGICRIIAKEPLKSKYNALISRVSEEIEIFHECLWQLAITKRYELFLTALFIALFWSFYFSIASVVLVGLGVKPYLFRSFILQTVMFLILPYIPTPGASGAAELGFAALFAPFVPFHLLGILVVAWRFLTYYLSTIFGGMIVLKLLAGKEDT